MYRALLGFLVVSSVILSLTTIFLLNQTSIDQQSHPGNSITNPKGTLGGAEDYNKQQNNLQLSFTNRLATHSYGVVAGLIALFFLYGKVYRSTKVMYLPLVSSTVAIGLYMYNTIVTQSNIQIFSNIVSNKQTLRVSNDIDSENMTNMYVDVSSSIVGLISHAFVFVYLRNRRL